MDNDARKARVLELGNQAKLELERAVQEYADFKAECTKVNPKIIALYRSAGLKPPAASPVVIMQYTNVGTQERASELADVLEVVASIATFVGLTKTMGPIVTKYLCNKTAVGADWASQELMKRSISLLEDSISHPPMIANKPVFEAEMTITKADVAGHVIAGVVAAATVGVMDTVIWAIEEEELKADLWKAIKALHPLRTAVYYSSAQTKAAKASIQTASAMVDAINTKSAENKKKALEDQTNVIVKSIEHAIAQSASIDDVISSLEDLDKTNNANTEDDPQYDANR